MFSISEHSFIDQLLLEYTSNQIVLNKPLQQHDRPAASTPPTKASPHKIAPKKTQQSSTSRSDFSLLRLIVPEIQRAKLPQENTVSPVDRALSAYRQGLDLTISCPSDDSKYALISELYLQNLLHAQGSGLHLFVTSFRDSHHLGHWLGTTVFANGLKRAWSPLLQDKAGHEKLMAEYLNLLKQTLTLRLPNKLTNTQALHAVLSLIPEFSKKVFFEKFNSKTKLFTEETTRKVARATSLSLKEHLEEKQVLEKISLAITETDELFSPNDSETSSQNQYVVTQLQQTLQRMRTAIAANDRQALWKALEWDLSFFRLDRKDDFSIKFYQIYYLFMGKLCAILPEFHQDLKNDPLPKENFSSFLLRLSETATVIEDIKQLYAQITPETKHKTVILTALFFESLNSETVDRLFSLPLRSFFLYGHDRQEPGEWHKLTAIIPKVLNEAKRHYPQESTPLHAIFADTISCPISCTSEKSF